MQDLTTAKTLEIPGMSLKDADFVEGKVLTTVWHPKGTYAWDTGEAISKFLAGLKEGKILGRQCHECGFIGVPPRMFCEFCFKPTHRWVQVKDTGTVNTFSVSFVNWDATRLQVPNVPAVIDLDGASPNVGIMHLIGEVGEQLEEILARVKVGSRVQAVWKPEAERTGAITDIKYFRLAQV